MGLSKSVVDQQSGRAQSCPGEACGQAPAALSGASGAVIIAGRGGRSGSWQRQRAQALEGGGELARPWPVALEAQGGAPGVEAESGGDVQEPIAQALGLATGELSVEHEPLGPAEQVLGQEHELEPDGVVLEVAERQLVETGLLGVADAVLDVRTGAVAPLDLCDV